jgi:hypothetical protein
MVVILYLKIKFKYINAQYINITKINNDNKLTFKLFKMSKQVIITYLKLSNSQKRHK